MNTLQEIREIQELAKGALADLAEGHGLLVSDRLEEILTITAAAIIRACLK